MNCPTVDELAGAYALGALEPDEDRAISDHLSTCDRPHTEARGLIDAAAALPASVVARDAPRALRDRILATAAATAQEHRPAPASSEQRSASAPARRPWWRLPSVPAALAAAALAVAVGLGAWNVSLSQQLADREAALRAMAAADAAYRASGTAGSGWVLEADGEAVFLADSLADLPPDRIYELWLIGPGGAPVAVGTVEDVDDLAVVRLERSLNSATIFAVTVEAERVEAPTSEPVLVAELET